MTITFVRDYPIEDTMVFEQCYEPELQIDAEFKAEICNAGVAVWMLVDGKLAGETYGATPHTLITKLDDCDLPDCDINDDASIYTYSTTVLPQYRGKGLGKILKAYFLALCEGLGYKRVIGHSTSYQMDGVNKLFGAQFGHIHTNWYDTKREAHFYEIVL